MPLYTAISEDGFLSDETRAKVAREITRIQYWGLTPPAVESLRSAE